MALFCSKNVKVLNANLGEGEVFFLFEQLQEVIAMEYNFKTFRILPAPTTPLLPHVLMAPS